MPNSSVTNQTSARQLSIMFLAGFAVNSIVIYAANALFPEKVVLGTFFFTQLSALVHSMVALTLITTAAIPVIEYFAEKQKLKLTDKIWMKYYLLVNFVGLWIVSRFALTLGMGISSWIVALILAVALSVVQGLAMKSIMDKVK